MKGRETVEGGERRLKGERRGQEVEEGERRVREVGGRI